MAGPSTIENSHPYRHVGTSNRKRRGKAPSSYSITNDLSGSESIRELQENITIFHEHDRRQPIDPSRRYFVSSYPELPQQNILDPIGYDGKKKVPAVHISSQAYARPPPQQANPDADPNYNSKWVVPRPKLGIFPKTERPEVFAPYRDYSVPPESVCHRESSHMHHSPSPIKTHSTKLTALDSHNPRPKIEYDASCYERFKKQPPLDLAPSVINSKAKVNIFQVSMMGRRKWYQSSQVGSTLADRIKKNSLN
jgi:hypothetical protein